MIIKKRDAQTQAIQAEPVPLKKTDPYEVVALTEDHFKSGKLIDRRGSKRAERRHNFRRIEDQEIISHAHEEANAIREKAYQHGFEEGLRDSKTAVTDMKNAMNGFLSAKEDALLSVSNDLSQMAIEIAERLLKTEVACDEDLVMTQVRNVISKVGRDQKSILIKVNPADARHVKEAMKQDSQISESVEIMVVEDPSVDQGSCMVETQAGLIDARFSTQLELLKKILLTGGKQ
jgi:flagellar assembly protein FliH